MMKKNIESDILLAEKELARLANQRATAKKKLADLRRRAAKMKKQRAADALMKIATPLFGVLSISEMEAVLKRAADVKKQSAGKANQTEE